MPQPPPPAPHVGAPPPGVPAVDEDPAAKVERSRSVSLLPHLGQLGATVAAETDWRRAKTFPQEVQRYS
jgi:hypothetical protein